MNLSGADSRTWTNASFEGKSILIYPWVSWCVPCWGTLPEIESVSARIKNRPDVQIVTLSIDEDRGKLSAFLKEKGYAFPVIVGKGYAEQILPRELVLGKPGSWIGPDQSVCSD